MLQKSLLASATLLWAWPLSKHYSIVAFASHLKKIAAVCDSKMDYRTMFGFYSPEDFTDSKQIHLPKSDRYRLPFSIFIKTLTEF